jgi:hypothetical protein
MMPQVRASLYYTQGGVKTEWGFPGLSVLRKNKKNGSTVPGKIKKERSPA